MMVFIVAIAAGQLLYAFGGAAINYPFMVLGRFIFGAGVATTDVAHSTIVAVWFRGKELAFALGITYTVTLATQLMGVTQANLFTRFEGMPV